MCVEDRFCQIRSQFMIIMLPVLWEDVASYVLIGTKPIKLEHYKIDSLVMNWIKSWLTQRTQSVVVNGVSSSPASILSGVPQSTVS